MPELPEVETVRRGLRSVLEGHRLARVTLRRRDLRIPFPKGFAAALTGRRVDSIGRRAKYLLLNLDDGHAAIIHLGMAGRMQITDPKVNQFIQVLDCEFRGSFKTPVLAASASAIQDVKFVPEVAISIAPPPTPKPAVAVPPQAPTKPSK